MKNKDQEIKKLHRLLQDNANSSDLMCKHYCCALLATHISYHNRINLYKFFYKFKNYFSEYDIIDFDDISTITSNNWLIKPPNPDPNVHI